MRIVEFERLLVAKATAIEFRLRLAIERDATMIEREARREIGHFQRGIGLLPRWPLLRPATPAEKRCLGYSPLATPLQRPGKLGVGIGHAVRGLGKRIDAVVGAKGVVARIQELGSRTVPARSYLERAARRMEAQAVRDIGESVARSLRMRP